MSDNYREQFIRDQKLTEIMPKELYNNSSMLSIASMAYDMFKSSQSTSLPPRADLYKENLVKQGYTWLDNVEMILCDTIEAPSLQDLFTDICDTISKSKVHTNGKSIVAIDFETSGLNRQWRWYGGQVRLPQHISGMGIAFITEDNLEVGMYVPVSHANTANHTLNDLKWLAQKLDEEFHIVYHNGLFDREVLHLNRVKLDDNWSDTMLMAIACQLKQSSKDSVGLKHLSSDILDRQMLEIGDVVKEAELYRIDAKSVLTYGCADVINTLRLYWTFRESEDFIDPYEDQKLIMGIDTVAADMANSMNRFNYPVHTTNAEKLARTVLRRALICEQKLRELSGNTIENIGSDDQVGLWMYNTILKDFKDELFDNETTPAKQKELTEALHVMLEKEIKMTIKTNTLKSGVVKIKASSGNDTIEGIARNIDKLYFLKDETKERLLDFTDILATMRSCDQSFGILSKLLRYTFVDDCPIPRVGAGVRFFGAISTRFANESGSGDDRVKFNTTTKGTDGKFIKGNGIAGLNAQGIPSDKPRNFKAKRLTKVPASVKEKMDKVSVLTENALVEYLTYNSKL